MNQHSKKFADFLERHDDVLTGKEIVIVTWHVLRLQYHDYQSRRHKRKMIRKNNKLANYETILDFRRDIQKL